MVGAAIETMVWSMKVIATAKIIAVRTRRFDGAPTPEPPKAFIVSPRGRSWQAALLSWVTLPAVPGSPDPGHGTRGNSLSHCRPNNRLPRQAATGTDITCRSGADHPVMRHF
jgi:hypothetical protein